MLTQLDLNLRSKHKDMKINYAIYIIEEIAWNKSSLLPKDYFTKHTNITTIYKDN